MAQIRVLQQDGGFRLPQSAFIVPIVLLIVAAIFLTTTWFQIDSDSVGVVTRFGRLDRVVEPGLHWKLPLGFESVAHVATRHVHKMEFGFRTAEVGGERTRYEDRPFSEESLMLTGDLNAAEVEWIVQYRIADPVKFLFRVNDPESTLRDLAQAVMSQVVGDHSVLEVLTEGRREVNAQVQEELQKLVDQYEIGLAIETVQLQNVDPPAAVRASFNDVNQAEQERARTINEARQEYNKAIPLAQGEALKQKQQAEGYAIDRINHATGETQRFLALLAEHEKAPDVMRRRLWLESMAEILPKLTRKVVVDDELKSLLPLLPIGPADATSPARKEGSR
jgi:membrane protease subunit HflK